MIYIKRALALTLALVLVVLLLPTGGRLSADSSTDRVLTIYFSGTGATSDWYLPENTSWHNTPELIASLYQNDDSQPITKTSYFGGLVYSISTELGHSHYKYIVDGIGTDFFSLIGQIDPDFGVRGWDACEDEAYLALDLVADPGDNIILNLIGWSRGGILTMKTARRVAADTRVGKINILAYDPVPGGFDPVGRFGDDLRLPAKVNQFIGIYARDERSYMFDPVIPDMSELPGTSKVWLVMVPGSHETMMGNFQDDGHSMTPFDLLGLLDWTVNDGMRPVNKVARAVAEQLLSSWEWGEVPIKELSPGNNKSEFLDLVSDMYDYDYWFARSTSFLPGWSSHDGLYWLTGRDHQLRIYWLTPVLHGRLCFVAPNRHAPEWVGLVWFPNVEQVYWLDARAAPMNGTAWNTLQSFRGSPPPDTTPPVPTVANLPTITGECSVTITTEPTAYDEVDGTVIGTTTDPLTYTEQGTYTITWTYTDSSGNTSTQTQTVIVMDTTPPTIENLVASPNLLWPLKHKMVPVVIDVTASDNCDEAPISRIISVSSNESENDVGDGNTEPDWEITGDKTLNLRAERSGTGSDRVYTITIECVDAVGNRSVSSVTVTVPHDLGKKK